MWWSLGRRFYFKFGSWFVWVYNLFCVQGIVVQVEFVFVISFRLGGYLIVVIVYNWVVFLVGSKMVVFLDVDFFGVQVYCGFYVGFGVVGVCQ